MNLQAAIEAELPFLRQQAESRMTSRVTILRKTGAKTKIDNIETDAWAAVASKVPFRSDSGSTADGGSRGVTIGAVTYEEATGVGHLPADWRDLNDGDLLLVESGEWADDVWRVVKAVRYDGKTARRVPIVEDRRPRGYVA